MFDTDLSHSTPDAGVSHVTLVKTDCNDYTSESEVSHVTLAKTDLDTIHNLERGIMPETLEELTGAGRFAVSISSKAPSIIAVSITLARKFLDKNAWTKWAADNFRLRGSYLHHLHKIGRMLVAIASDKTLYRRLYGLDVDKQYSMTFVDVHQLPNFFAHYPKLDLETISRIKLRAITLAWPEEPKDTGDDGEDAKPEQLTFNLFDEITDDRLEQIIAHEDFDTCGAIVMVDNGARLCRTAIPYMAQHPEEFGPDDLPALEEMYRNLDDASHKILALINIKKQEQLQITE